MQKKTDRSRWSYSLIWWPWTPSEEDGVIHFVSNMTDMLSNSISFFLYLSRIFFFKKKETNPLNSSWHACKNSFSYTFNFLHELLSQVTCNPDVHKITRWLFAFMKEKQTITPEKIDDDMAYIYIGDWTKHIIQTRSELDQVLTYYLSFWSPSKIRT